MSGLPEIQQAIVEGDKEVFYYQFQGPQLVVWKNPYEPRFRRWQVMLYPNGTDFSMKRNDWYHDGFPYKRYAIQAGQEKLREAAFFWAREHAN